MSPINSNFFYYEKKCPVCGHPMLTVERGNAIPCTRCVKDGNAAVNDKPVVYLTFEEPNDDTER